MTQSSAPLLAAAPLCLLTKLQKKSDHLGAVDTTFFEEIEADIGHGVERAIMGDQQRIDLLLEFRLKCTVVQLAQDETPGSILIRRPGAITPTRQAVGHPVRFDDLDILRREPDQFEGNEGVNIGQIGIARATQRLT